MASTLIITLPEHDLPTKYSSLWSSKIIEVAHKMGVKVIDLHREKAEKSQVLGRLKKLQPELLVLNGHGNESVIAGHDNVPIITETDKISPVKIIFARACSAAKSLGKRLVDGNYVKAFIGYDEDFVIRIDTSKIQRELDNELAEMYLTPSNQVPIALLKGATAEEANQKSKEMSRKIIKKIFAEGPKSEFYDEIKYLFWNMDHQVCLGDKDAKI